MLAALALTLVACTPRMDDNSLEAATLTGGDGDGETGLEVTGVVTVTAGTAEGDWTIAVDTATLTYHSPSHADLGSLSGETLTVATQPDYSATAGLLLSDDGGPRFVETSGTSWDGGAGEDGRTAFGHAVWTRGDVIGKGTVVQLVDGVDEEEQEVTFTDVVVTDDTGSQRLTPGVPTALTIDGAPWRFTVLAAYLAVNAPNAKCGAPDILAVEALRTDVDPGPALVRPAALYSPVGMCG